jgi:hypothetical protein
MLSQQGCVRSGRSRVSIVNLKVTYNIHFHISREPEHTVTKARLFFQSANQICVVIETNFPRVLASSMIELAYFSFQC